MTIIHYLVAITMVTGFFFLITETDRGSMDSRHGFATQIPFHKDKPTSDVTLT